MPGSGLRGLVATEDIPAGESAIAVPAALCVQLGSAASQGAVRPHLHRVLSQHANGIQPPSCISFCCFTGTARMQGGQPVCMHSRGQKLPCCPMASTCFGWNAARNALCCACSSGMLETTLRITLL